jgi:hypothetical protein
VPVAFERRYSPPEFVSAYRVPISGNPDPDRVRPPHVERFNLTLEGVDQAHNAPDQRP